MKNSKDLFHPMGFDSLLGCDEAGRGPVAGPLYCAGVYFRDYSGMDKILDKLNDSKQLNEKTRERLFPLILQNTEYAIKEVDIETIETINILNASLFGMKQCALEIINKTELKNPIVIIDGNKEFTDFDYSKKAVIKGDSKSASVACASILAKVSRDRVMLELDKIYPNYNFKKNKGYLTKEHIEAIKKYGLSPVHRKTFLKKFLNN